MKGILGKTPSVYRFLLYVFTHWTSSSHWLPFLHGAQTLTLCFVYFPIKQPNSVGQPTSFSLEPFIWQTLGYFQGNYGYFSKSKTGNICTTQQTDETFIVSSLGLNPRSNKQQTIKHGGFLAIF